MSRRVASVDPEEVRVPVIVAWRRVDERDGALAEQVEKLSRAAYDHRSRAEPVDRRLSNLRSEPVFVEEPAQQLTTADPIELGQIGDRCSSSGGGAAPGGRLPRARCGRC